MMIIIIMIMLVIILIIIIIIIINNNNNDNYIYKACYITPLHSHAGSGFPQSLKRLW